VISVRDPIHGLFHLAGQPLASPTPSSLTPSDRSIKAAMIPMQLFQRIG
jgi:hypothetical protein